MPNTSFDTSTAIANLQAGWHALTGPDRAEAILPIIESGVSNRELAPSLHCSEALIRRLLGCLKAEPEDLELARNGQISTNELVRRAREAEKRRDGANAEAARLRCKRRAEDASRTILHWLAGDPAAAGNAEQIVQEARHHMKLAEMTGGIPSRPAPVDMTVDEIIRRTRPVDQTDDQIDVGWYGGWLAEWSFFAFPDHTVLWDGLGGALSAVEHRSWRSKL